jgi:hypothetical protein
MPSSDQPWVAIENGAVFTAPFLLFQRLAKGWCFHLRAGQLIKPANMKRLDLEIFLDAELRSFSPYS